MREIQPQQMQIGEIDIAAIEIDAKSRDDIPQLLKGLQYLYTNKTTREQLFSTLRTLIPDKIDINNGRPGMDLWRIFVLGMLRLNLNIDYDRLQGLANEYRTIRAILGHSEWDKTYYECQTLKDNVRLFTPEVLDKMNQIIVQAGHGLVKKKKRG